MDASKFFDKSWYGKCVPTELRQQLRPWSEIRTDGVAGNEFPVAPAPAASDSTSRKTWRASVLSARGPYCEYVNKEWREYNKSKGLSTVNLCQCPNHYVFESLGVPGACRNFKSYKKIVLKKLGTQSKHSDKKNAKRLTGAQDNLRCWRNIVSRDILVYDNAVRSATASAQELLRQKSDIESHRLCVHRSHGRLSDIYSRHAQNKSLCEKINHAIEEIK